MGKLLPLLLAFFLVACPELCRSDTLGCCADRCEESGTPDDHPPTPEPAQNEAVSCICAGALRDSSPQPHAKAKLGDRSPTAFPFVSISFSIGLSSPVTRSGEPPGRDPGGPLRIHLMLQNFRC